MKSKRKLVIIAIIFILATVPTSYYFAAKYLDSHDMVAGLAQNNENALKADSSGASTSQSGIATDSAITTSPAVVTAAAMVTSSAMEVSESSEKENNSTIVVRGEEALYAELHQMANTKIVPIDGQIWGEIEITPERCDDLINEFKASNYNDKAYVIEILGRWKENDFTNAVNEHNYFWEKLDGSVGYAVSLK